MLHIPTPPPCGNTDTATGDRVMGFPYGVRVTAEFGRDDTAEILTTMDDIEYTGDTINIQDMDRAYHSIQTCAVRRLVIEDAYLCAGCGNMMIPRVSSVYRGTKLPHTIRICPCCNARLDIAGQ